MLAFPANSMAPDWLTLLLDATGGDCTAKISLFSEKTKSFGHVQFIEAEIAYRNFASRNDAAGLVGRNPAVSLH